MTEFKKEKSISLNQAQYSLFLRVSDGNCYSKEIYVILKSCSKKGDSKTGRILGISVSKCIIWRQLQDNKDIQKYLQVDFH